MCIVCRFLRKEYACKLLNNLDTVGKLQGSIIGYLKRSSKHFMVPWFSHWSLESATGD